MSVVINNMRRDLTALSTYRALMINLLKRDLHLKYRSSIMGYCWSFINPLIMIFVYIFAFKYILMVRTVNGANLSAQIIVGITYWTLFNSIISSSANCILQDSSLIMKVRFPRIISVMRNHLFLLSEHFLVYPFLILALYAYYQLPLTWMIFWIIPFFLLYNVLIFGLSMLIGTLTIYYRDIAHFVGLGMQILFWLTPIVYPLDLIPDRFYPLIAHMPASPFVISFYKIFLYGELPEFSICVSCVAYPLIAFALGGYLFYKCQHRFAEEF